MNRMSGKGFSEAIGRAYDVIPQEASELLSNVHFVCGVNPNFAGIHNVGGRLTTDAHCCFPWGFEHKDNVTIVMPEPDDPWVVVHELGHALDYMLGFPDVPLPVTGYADTNDYEAFAEAFTMAHTPGYAPWDSSLRRLARYKRENPDLAHFFTPSP